MISGASSSSSWNSWNSHFHGSKTPTKIKWKKSRGPASKDLHRNCFPISIASTLRYIRCSTTWRVSSTLIYRTTSRWDTSYNRYRTECQGKHKSRETWSCSNLSTSSSNSSKLRRNNWYQLVLSVNSHQHHLLDYKQWNSSFNRLKVDRSCNRHLIFDPYSQTSLQVANSRLYNLRQTISFPDSRTRVWTSFWAVSKRKRSRQCSKVFRIKACNQLQCIVCINSSLISSRSRNNC